jgi:hypothetical protein
MSYGVTGIAAPMATELAVTPSQWAAVQGSCEATQIKQLSVAQQAQVAETCSEVQSLIAGDTDTLDAQAQRIRTWTQYLQNQIQALGTPQAPFLKLSTVLSTAAGACPDTAAALTQAQGAVEIAAAAQIELSYLLNLATLRGGQIQAQKISAQKAYNSLDTIRALAENQG